MNAGRKKGIIIITIVIISVMILVPILSIIMSFTSSSNESTGVDRNIKEQTDNETALKIIDMHENLTSYENQELS